MGQELACTLRLGDRALAGKAYLQTDHLLFRGEERLKLMFKDLTGVSAVGGVLTVEYPGGPALFELGQAAGKWAEKILHPPSRADKLGLKPGASVRLIGPMEDDFVRELQERGLTIVQGHSRADLVFLAAARKSDLTRVPKARDALQPNGALWILYPKGVPEIREIEVIDAGRAAGLKDVKVASFSPTHTALKFVIPVASRPARP
jgi:hypothetical protein